jgi:hypothetical protein
MTVVVGAPEDFTLEAFRRVAVDGEGVVIGPQPAQTGDGTGKSGPPYTDPQSVRARAPSRRSGLLVNLRRWLACDAG